MPKRAFLSLVVASLIGCSTSDPFMLPARQSTSFNTKATSEEMFRSIESDYTDALRFCNTVMDSMWDSFHKQRNLSVGLALGGAIAGSIIVPALAASESFSKAAIAGWGGVSGAANAGQYVLNNNGASPYQTAQVYTTMREEIRGHMRRYAKANLEDRPAVVSDLAAVCMFKPMPNVAAPTKPTDDAGSK